MSLIYGFSEGTPQVVEDKTKVQSSVVIFTNSSRETVKVFDKGIVLLGIVTTSAAPFDHQGYVLHNIYSPDGSTLVSSIRPQSGNYFPILNQDSNDKALSLRTVYTVPRPCSVMTTLGGGVPPNPVVLNITLYYVEVPVHEYGS